MSNNVHSYIPIDDGQLKLHLTRANSYLKNVKWSPSVGNVVEAGSNIEDKGGYRGSTDSLGIEDTLSIMEIAQKKSGNDVLLNDSIHHVLVVLRKGLMIGMHVAGLYTKFSGLGALMEQNNKKGGGGLSGTQIVEFRNKLEVASAITIFCTANFVVWDLSRYQTDDVNLVKMDAPRIDIKLPGAVEAIKCMLFYYAAYLKNTNIVNTDLDFVKFALLYFQGVIDEIKNREETFKHTEAFTSKSYKLKDSEFCLNGFEVMNGSASVSVEFNRVDLKTIVGNRDAKHKARRLAERIICYDMVAQKNPMHDLGGLPTLRMGHGEPGTGKSLQIAATATLLDDYCKLLGIPFLFRPMPDNLISSFQGTSGDNANNWMKPLGDPSCIIYAPIDDGECNLEERTRQGVSEGVRQVVAVFLRRTEGAYAINHGNAVIEIFTNLPEQIDKAVLSRIMDRFYIGGAMTREDFLDQDHGWYRKFKEIDSDFVNMDNPKDYEFGSAQVLLPSLSKVYEGYEKPTDERIREVFDQVSRKFKTTEHDFFAHFFMGVKKIYPLFTSRDVRNIQMAVNERTMDFDLDRSWLENPDLFLKKDYETKRSMIVKLMKDNMQGLSFAKIRLQETIRYMDSLAKIVFATEERKIAEMVEGMLVREKALERHVKLKGMN